MQRQVFRLTALYVLSLSTLAVVAIDPPRATAMIRRQARLVVEPFRDAAAAETTTPVTALPTSARPASVPAKPQRAGLDYYRISIGTVVSARLRTPIDSSANQVNDQVDAVLAEAIAQDGVELIPAGSLLHGTIVRIVAPSRQAPLGQVSLAFAILQHAETGSRAPFPTRTLTIEAQAPADVARVRRLARRQPIDLVLPAGHRLLLTLEQPVVVGIPRAGRSSQVASD